MALHPAHPMELETSQSPNDGMREIGTMEGGERPAHSLGSEGWEFPRVIQPLDICFFGGQSTSDQPVIKQTGPGGSHM